MSDFVLKTPIVFIIFNRPHLARRVFEEIRKAKPQKLYIIADSPRVNNVSDQPKCIETRKIVEDVDWDCTVIKNYADQNMGCGRRISSGLDWVFSMEEEAIILEDDCLPQPTLFRFYQELLEYYRNDDRIMSIGGNNYKFKNQRLNYSYHFSRYPHVWGWATWRRVWKKYYDFYMDLWPEIRNSQWLIDLFCALRAESSEEGDTFSIYGGREDANYWHNKFNALYQRAFDTWDYQFFFACFLQHGLTVLPNVNLVSNIGFGYDATHTGQKSELADVPIEPVEFPLKHPPYMIRDSWVDAYMQLIFNRSC